MRFAFIAKHRSVWPGAWLCEALDVSRSGSHARLRRGPGARAIADEELAAKIRASCRDDHAARHRCIDDGRSGVVANRMRCCTTLIGVANIRASSSSD
jgi:hypothetical protein